MCETLWLDIKDFYEENKDNDNHYFLGSIVINKNEENKKDLDVVDGQQRLTTISLMLRAFYDRVKCSPNEAQGLIDSIEKCLFEVDSITNKAK